MTSPCPHGQLARQCPICERDAEIAKLKADIRCMIEKAAAKSLDGYRELGMRAAHAENERDRVAADRDRLATENAKLTRKLEVLEDYATTRLCNGHIGHWERHRCVLCERDRLAAENARLQKYLVNCNERMDGLRRACAQLLKQDEDTWPSNDNAPLAIAAALAFAQIERNEAEADRDRLAAEIARLQVQLADSIRDLHEIADRNNAIESLNERLEKDAMIPGVMRCAKCKFRLVRTNLYVQSGTAGPGSNETEPCPNGCGPLWPVTWKQEASENMETAERFLAERVAAEADRDRLAAEIVRLRDGFDNMGVDGMLCVGAGRLVELTKAEADRDRLAAENKRLRALLQD